MARRGGGTVLDLPYLEPIHIKESFYFFLLALFISAIPALALRGLISSLLLQLFNNFVVGCIMLLVGYIITFALLSLTYEFLKRGKIILTLGTMWRMYLAWFKSLIFLMPAIIFAFILMYGGTYLTNYSTAAMSAGWLLIGTGAIMLLFLTLVSFVLQWYFYEVGPD
jgi:hypothetical protein